LQAGSFSIGSKSEEPASCQGTTSVVPPDRHRLLGFSPCALSLLQICRSGLVLLRHIHEACCHWIFVDILPVLLKAPLILNTHIGISALPNLASKSQFLAGPKGKAAFDQLHRFLKTYLAWNCHQDVNVVRYDDKVVNGQLLGLCIRPQNVDEEICHAISLEEGSSACCSCSYKESSRASCGVVRVRWPGRFRHRRG